MNFSGLKQLVDVASLGQGVGKLLQLRRLTMNFAGCERLMDVTSLGQGVGQLHNLRQEGRFR